MQIFFLNCWMNSFWFQEPSHDIRSVLRDIPGRLPGLLSGVRQGTAYVPSPVSTLTLSSFTCIMINMNADDENTHNFHGYESNRDYVQTWRWAFMVDINALLVFMSTIAIVLLQFYLVAPRNAVQSCHLHLRRSAQIHPPPEPWWMDREGDLLLGESTQHASNYRNVPKAINWCVILKNVERLLSNLHQDFWSMYFFAHNFKKSDVAFLKSICL